MSVYLIKARLNFTSNFLDLKKKTDLNISTRSISEILKPFKKFAVMYNQNLDIHSCWSFKQYLKFDYYTGLLIFRGKKKQNFAGFSGANSRKNRSISRDFRGKKVKIRGKIGRFQVFLQEKSQNSEKNRPISRDFRGKMSNFEGFSEANS